MPPSRCVLRPSQASSKLAAWSCPAAPMSCSTTKTCAERISGISVESFLQLVASGIATGIIYGSLGLAFVIVFQATRTLNLAQGEIAALGTFGAWTLLQLGLPYWVVFVLMVGGSFVGGFIIHRLLIRPLDGKSHFSVIV